MAAQELIVYKITNIVNNKVYLGITKCGIRKRWNEHKCRAKNPKSHLHFAMNKYGIDNFIIEELYKCSSDKEMYAMEIKLISQYQSNDNRYGYNNSTGGESSSRGKKLSEEVKRKISKFQRIRVRTPHSPESKKNMSLAAKGRDMTLRIQESVKATKGKKAHNRVMVILNGDLKYDSISSAAKIHNITTGSICNNIKGLSKTTKVGVWRTFQHEI